MPRLQSIKSKLSEAKTRNANKLLSIPYVTRGVLYYGTFVFLLALVGIPLGFYVWGSFWSTSPGLGGTFTLSGYDELFRPNVYETVGNTIAIAVLGTTIAVVMGISGVFFAVKTDVKGKAIITLLFIVQYMIPEYLSAIAWNFWAGYSGFLNTALMWLFALNEPPINLYSILGISLVGGLHYSGLVYLLVAGAVGSVPSSLEEASLLNGASGFTTFRKITLKLAIPSIGIAVVLVFARLIQSFGVPIILGVPGGIFVVATHMYYAIQNPPPNFTFASALGMVILVVSLVGLALQRLVTGVREKYEVIGGGGGGDLSTMTYSLKRPYLILVPFVLILLGMYVIPYLSLVLNGFQSNPAGLHVWRADWTLANYETLFVGTRSDQFLGAVKNTFVVSFVGATIGMVVCSIASYVIVKSESPIAGFLDFLTLTPAAIPGIIVGTAFLWLFLTFNFLGLYGTIWIIMIALTSRFIVYGVRATNSSFRSIGDELEEMGRLSGAGLFQIMKDIYVPLIKPGFTAGFFLLFVDYMKVLTIPLLLQGPNSQMLSAAIYEMGVLGRPQVAAAIGTVMIVLVIGVYTIAHIFTQRGISEI